MRRDRIACAANEALPQTVEHVVYESRNRPV
jgi:hypothetical protein